MHVMGVYIRTIDTRNTGTLFQFKAKDYLKMADRFSSALELIKYWSTSLLVYLNY